MGRSGSCPSKTHTNPLILQSVSLLPRTLANLFPPSPPYFLPLPSPLEGPKGRQVQEVLWEEGARKGFMNC